MMYDTINYIYVTYVDKASKSEQQQTSERHFHRGIYECRLDPATRFIRLIPIPNLHLLATEMTSRSRFKAFYCSLRLQIRRE